MAFRFTFLVKKSTFIVLSILLFIGMTQEYPRILVGKENGQEKSNPKNQVIISGENQISEVDIKTELNPDDLSNDEDKIDQSEDSDNQVVDLDERGNGHSKNKLRFSSCKTKMKNIFNVIEEKSEEKKIYILKEAELGQVEPRKWISLKKKNYKELKGAYRFYFRKITNANALNGLENVLPEFKGCQKRVSSKDKHKIKSIELVYEKFQSWEKFFEKSEYALSNRIIVEMVHQIFWFFKKLFRTGMFVKKFQSKSIGVRMVPDADNLFNVKKGFYSSKNLAFVFNNPMDLAYHCNFLKDKHFKQLVEIFTSQKKRDFSFKNESKIEICHQINIYNLLMVLEVGLFRSAKMAFPSNGLFEGCLDEKIDRGKTCPAVVLYILGMDSNKNVIRSNLRIESHIKNLKALRANFLNYKTNSLMNWFEFFLVDLMNAFTVKNVHEMSRVIMLYLNKVFSMIANFEKIKAHIIQMRDTKQDPSLYETEFNNILQGLERLYKIRESQISKLADHQESQNKIHTPAKMDMTFGQESSPVVNKGEIGIQTTPIDNTRLTYRPDSIENQIDMNVLVQGSSIIKQEKQDTIQSKVIPQNDKQIQTSPDKLNNLSSGGQISPSKKSELNKQTTIQKIEEDSIPNSSLTEEQIAEDIVLGNQQLNQISELEDNISSERETQNNVEIDSGIKRNVLGEHEQYSFRSTEQVAFVERIDKEGIEYISMEINLKILNPSEFGFDNYDAKKDQGELEQRVQDYFLKELSKKDELEGMNITHMMLI